MTNDLAALSEAATQGEWELRHDDEIWALDDDGDFCLADAHKDNAAFIVALVNRFRSGRLVLIDREGMRERVFAAISRIFDGMDGNLHIDDMTIEEWSIADAAIAAILPRLSS